MYMCSGIELKWVSLRPTMTRSRQGALRHARQDSDLEPAYRFTGNTKLYLYSCSPQVTTKGTFENCTTLILCFLYAVSVLPPSTRLQSVQIGYRYPFVLVVNVPTVRVLPPYSRWMKHGY